MQVLVAIEEVRPSSGWLEKAEEVGTWCAGDRDSGFSSRYSSTIPHCIRSAPRYHIPGPHTEDGRKNKPQMMKQLDL